MLAAQGSQEDQVSVSSPASEAGWSGVAVCIAAAFLTLLACAAVAAVTVVNPGFETDAYAVSPGYATDNGPISGWTVVGIGCGLNPIQDGQSPFADNGRIPEGRQVALIQNAGVISQTVSGLVPGRAYIVMYRYNARSVAPYAMPILKLTFGDAVLQSNAVTSVGGTNAYYLGVIEYTALAAETELKLENAATAGDSALLLDDVRIVEAEGYTGWVMAPLTGDADCRLDPKAHYTHALDSAGTAGGRSANDVSFERPVAPVGGLLSGLNWSLTGAPNGVGGQSAYNVTGGIGALLSDFWYNGNPATVTLSGLLPGTPHVATFYNRGYGGAGGRVAGLAADDAVGGPALDAVTYDQNYPGADNGSLLEYRYVAPTSGMIRFSFPFLKVGTFHQYAVSNRRVLPTVGVLFADSFNSGSQQTDINVNHETRQSGILAPLTYTQGGPANGAQVGDATTHHPGVLETLDWGWAGLDRNFNGADSRGWLRISFDLDPTWGTNENWGAICLGADSLGSGMVTRADRHFGILFRGDGRLQAFDGGTIVSSEPDEPRWGVAGGTFHRFSLLLTDPTDLNPCDGQGRTTIEVFVDGGTTPVFSFTKTDGGYPNNYINVQGIAARAEFDNLLIESAPAGTVAGTVLLVW